MHPDPDATQLLGPMRLHRGLSAARQQRDDRQTKDCVLQLHSDPPRSVESRAHHITQLSGLTRRKSRAGFALLSLRRYSSDGAESNMRTAARFELTQRRRRGWIVSSAMSSGSPRIKGLAIRGMFQALKRLHGDETLRRLIEELPPE